MTLTGKAKWGVAACALGLIVAMPITLRQTSEDRPAPEPQPEERDVRVEHELIAVAEPSPPAPAARPNPVRAVPPAARARAERADATTSPGKVRRAFLGDGRYRPEPFPRAR